MNTCTARYRIIDTSYSNEGDLNAQVAAGAVRFIGNGESLVWDDRFVEQTSPLEVRDLTAMVQTHSVKRSLSQLFIKERASNLQASRLGLGLLLAVFILGGVFATNEIAESKAENDLSIVSTGRSVDLYESLRK